jgi:hypothetical protein
MPRPLSLSLSPLHTEVLPLAAFIFYLKTFIGLMKSLEEVKPHWVVDFNFVLTVFPLDILRGTHHLLTFSWSNAGLCCAPHSIIPFTHTLGK